MRSRPSLLKLLGRRVSMDAVPRETWEAAIQIAGHEESHTPHSDAGWLQRRLDRVRERRRRLSKRRGRPQIRAANAGGARRQVASHSNAACGPAIFAPCANCNFPTPTSSNCLKLVRCEVPAFRFAGFPAGRSSARLAGRQPFRRCILTTASHRSMPAPKSPKLVKSRASLLTLSACILILLWIEG